MTNNQIKEKFEIFKKHIKEEQEKFIDELNMEDPEGRWGFCANCGEIDDLSHDITLCYSALQYSCLGKLYIPKNDRDRMHLKYISE